MPWSVETIIQSGGLLAIFLVVFSESGLFFGILFPGDSLLLAAGFLAGQDIISIYWLIPVVIIAAILGDNVGYRIGRQLGPKLFTREDGILFRRDYLQKTDRFYKKHGGKTIVVARFIAVVRTFAPVVAGAGGMKWSRFAFFNVLGGVLWGAGLPLLGYAIGSNFPDLDQYFLWGLFISAQVVLIFVLWQILKNPETRAHIKIGIHQEWRHYFGKKNR